MGGYWDGGLPTFTPFSVAVSQSKLLNKLYMMKFFFPTSFPGYSAGPQAISSGTPKADINLMLAFNYSLFDQFLPVESTGACEIGKQVT